MSLLVPYEYYLCFQFGGVYICSYVCLCMYELEVGTECLLLLSTFKTGSFIELGAFQTGWPSSPRGLTACVFLGLGLWTHIAKFDFICEYWYSELRSPILK